MRRRVVAWHLRGAVADRRHAIRTLVSRGSRSRPSPGSPGRQDPSGPGSPQTKERCQRDQPADRDPPTGPGGTPARSCVPGGRDRRQRDEGVQVVERIGGRPDADHDPRSEQRSGEEDGEQRHQQAVQPAPALHHSETVKRTHQDDQAGNDRSRDGDPRVKLGEERADGSHVRNGTPATRGRAAGGGRRASAGRASSAGLGARAAGGIAALGVLFLLAIGQVAGAGEQGNGRGGGTAPGTGAAGSAVTEAGRGLYTANCAACHGVGGGGSTAGPSLVGVGAASADFYLRTGRMPLSAPGQRVVRQAPHFDDGQIRALVAYVASLGTGPEVPQVKGGGDIRTGWELFQANCAACHNATGSGNAIGGGFVAVGLGQADPTTVAEATIIGPGAMPAFGFDDTALADLAAYIRWLRDAPTPGGAAIGQTGPVAEGFVGVAVGLPLLLLASLFVARHGRGARAPGRARPREEDR